MSRMTRRVLIRTTSAAAGVATFGILTGVAMPPNSPGATPTSLGARHSMNVICSRQRNVFSTESGAGMEVRNFFPYQLGGDVHAVQLRTGRDPTLPLWGEFLSTSCRSPRLVGCRT